MLRIVLLAVSAILGLLLVGVGVLVGTETGSRYLLDKALPEFIAVEQIDGRLIGPLTLANLRITVPGTTIDINRAELDWQPAALLGADVQVGRLEAHGVVIAANDIVAEEPAAAEQPFSLPERIDLPVAIEVTELTVTNVEYHGADAENPLVVDRIELSAAFDDARLELRRLQVAAPLFDAGIDAELSTAGDYPISAAADIELRPEGYAVLRSTTNIDGDLQRLRIREAVAAPYNLTASAILTTPLEQLGLDAEANFSDLYLPDVQAELPPATLSFDAAADGSPTDLALQADVAATYEQQTVNGHLIAALQEQTLNIETLTVSQPDGDAGLRARGAVVLNDKLDTELTLNWENLQWPLAGVADYRSARGEAVIDGSLDGYTLSADTQFTLPGDAPIQAELSGEGDSEHINTELQLGALDGRIDGTAAVVWSPSLDVKVRLNGQGFDPGAIHPDWPGALDFTLRAAADTVNDELSARLETLTVTGELREQPLDVEATGSYESGAAVIQRLEAALGSARLSAEGRYADEVNLAWELNAQDLGELLPEASGEVSSSGSLRGRAPRVKVVAELHAASLSYLDFAVDALDVNGDVDLTDDGESTLTVNVAGAQTSAVTAERLALELNGKQSEHRLELTAQTSQGNADIGINGELQGLWDDAGAPAWLFGLTNAVLEYPELAPWELVEQADGRVSAEEVSVSRHCWESGSAELCMAAERGPERLLAEFDLNDLGFDYFASFVPSALEIEGALSGTGTVEQRAGQPLQSDIKLTTSAGAISTVASVDDEDEEEAPAAPATETFLNLEPSTVSVRLDDAGGSAVADLNFAEGKVDLNVALPAGEAPLTKRSIDGRLEVDVPDIGIVAPFVADIKRLAGSIDGRLTFAGELARPSVSGRLGLQEGSFESAAAGIEVTDITLDLVGRGRDGMGLDGSASSGGGSLNVNGEFGISEEPATADITLAGEAFQLVGTKQASVYASPDLRIKVSAEAIEVSGGVAIPRAEITPDTLPPSAVKASADVVEMVPETEQVEDAAVAARAVNAEVDISLGEEVRFEGFGLKARFTGETTIIEEPGQLTSATGQIDIADGEYRAYGQGLVIESGRIIFAGGPVTQPALDIRAVRRPEEDILVGAEVRGSITEPEFTLFSEPSMTQQEQLSYLVLGRSLADAPEGESSALQQASLARGVKGGNFLAENIGENLGVDEFAIQSGSGEAGAASNPADAALVIGKYLSPKLYLSYGVGLFNPISVLRMRYDFTQSLKLVTESGSEGAGADLIYIFERGLERGDDES